MSRSSRILGTSLWKRTRLAILARDGHRCQINGPGCAGHASTVDHIRPLASGGDAFDPANLRAACRRCNYSRGAALSSLSRRPRIGFSHRQSRRW